VSATLPTLAALALSLAAGAAAAQSPVASPAPQQSPPATTPAAPLPERPRAGGSTLNLQLDDSARRRIMSGTVEEGSSRSRDLPSLGEGARPLDHSQRSTPFPKTYNDAQAPD